MTKAIPRGHFDVLAVTRIDRAFRSIVDMELAGRNVRFAATTQPIDTRRGGLIL